MVRGTVTVRDAVMVVVEIADAAMVTVMVKFMVKFANGVTTGIMDEIVVVVTDRIAVTNEDAVDNLHITRTRIHYTETTLSTSGGLFIFCFGSA